MVKPLLSNLGFLLQMTGLFVVLPTGVAFYLGEKEAAIAFLITSLAFLAFGFFLNSLSVRKTLDFKSCSALLVVVFVMLGLIGSIPYLYLDVFNTGADPFGAFTSSFFQSISGYTSTGLNLIPGIDALPKSLIIYMSLTEWIGGLGIVFLLLVFFYPKTKLAQLGKAINVNGLRGNIRKSFLWVLGIYVFYTIIFVLIFLLLGLDSVNSLAVVFTGLSTGGFAPVTNLSQILSAPIGIVLAILMIFGSTSFVVHYSLLKRKFREVLSSELMFFLLLIAVFSILFAVVQQVNVGDAFFHVVSASSTSGFSYMNLSGLTSSAKLIFIFLMFVGGCAFSTAGGIKVWRFLVFLKSIPCTLKEFLTSEKTDVCVGGKRVEDDEVRLVFSLILLSIVSILVFSFIFSLCGFPLIDAMFELTSAFGTVGLSVGISSYSLDPLLKWILSFEMILGRVEIIALLAVIVNLPQTHGKRTFEFLRTFLQKIWGQLKKFLHIGKKFDF